MVKKWKAVYGGFKEWQIIEKGGKVGYVCQMASISNPRRQRRECMRQRQVDWSRHRLEIENGCICHVHNSHRRSYTVREMAMQEIGMQDGLKMYEAMRCFDDSLSGKDSNSDCIIFCDICLIEHQTIR